MGLTPPSPAVQSETGSAKRQLAELLSYLTFEAPGLRLALELGLCFVIFEIGARILGKDAVSVQDPTLLFVWLGGCTLIGIVDRFLFYPPLRAFESALKLSLTDCVESAVSAFSELDPNRGKLVHFPKKL
jgi:hypothetical protein